MKRSLIVISVSVFVLGAVYAVITLYDRYLPAGRMWDTPAIRPHENPIPDMYSGTVPFAGGEAQFRSLPADALTPPFYLQDPDVIAEGKEGYGFFCIHCHGKYHDGQGTVGQSFSPLPGDLRSSKVQTAHPGALFKEISYGIPGTRQPPLATTIDIDDRWRIVAYVKSLGSRP